MSEQATTTAEHVEYEAPKVETKTMISRQCD
jgi:hypothetical protein